MIQIIMKSMSMFCGGPLKYIAPLFMPLINPSSWSVLVICVIIPIYWSKVSTLNSDDGKEKSYKRTLGVAFGIYYAIMIVLLCSIMQSICKVNDQYNPY